jgi:hypothetical protein
MDADRFLYEMRRWEEDIAEHPQELAAFANQTRMLNNLERLQRDLAVLADVLKRGTSP